jgi:hypothetical protein
VGASQHALPLPALLQLLPLRRGIHRRLRQAAQTDLEISNASLG